MHLSPSEIASAMEAAVSINQNLLVWGPPGIGKTAIAYQVARKLGRKLVVAPIATMDAADARMPQIKDGRVSFLVADWLPTEADGPCILFVDEINRGRTDVQNAFLSLCGPERRMGSYALPDACAILGAANPSETSSGVNKLVDALADRFIHVTIKPDAKHADWQKWAAANGMPAELIAFARWRPACMYAYEKGELVTPTYRSWERVGRVLLARYPQNIERALVEGCVGAGPAVEVLSFVEEFRRLAAVSIDAILMNPDTAPVPDAGAHATSYAIANALSRRMDVPNIGRVLRYLARMPREFATMAIQDALERDPVLGSTPEYTLWNVDHPQV